MACVVAALPAQILYHVMRGHRMLTYAVADSSKVHLSIENQLPPPSECVANRCLLLPCDALRL